MDFTKYIRMQNYISAFYNTPFDVKVNFIKSMLLRSEFDLHTKFIYSQFKTIEMRFGFDGFTSDALNSYEHIKALRQKVINSVGDNVCGALQLTSAIALYSFVKNIKPKLIIETGVASGFSSRVILEAMEENHIGKLISIDLPNYTNKEGYHDQDGTFDKVYTPKKFGVGWLVPNKLKHRWNLLLGNSQKILPNIKESPEIFLHDSDHSYTNMTYEFKWAVKKTKYLLADDITRNNAWTETMKFSGITKSLMIKTFGIAQINNN